MTRPRSLAALLAASVALGNLTFPRAAAAQGAPAASATPAASAAPASAAPTADQIAKAKTLFDLGAKAYDAEQFPAAIQAFQEAYRLSQRPGPVFSTAQAYRRLYNMDRNAETLRQAVANYKLYIEKQKSGGRITEAQQALKDLEPLLSQASAAPGTPVPVAPVAALDEKPKTRLMVSSPTKGALVSLDGGEPAEMPLFQELTPGPHKLRLTAEGYVDDERDIIAAEGQVYGLDLTLRERPAFLTLRTDGGAAITVDGRDEGVAPLFKPIELTPGSHLVTVTRNGYRAYSVELELRRDEKRPLDVTLERTPQRFASFVVLGGAAIGAITGGVLTGLAFHEQAIAQDIETAAGTRHITEDERSVHELAVANRNDLRNAAFVSFGAAGLFAILSAGLFVFDRPSPGIPEKLRNDAPKPPEAKRPAKTGFQFVPVVGPTGGGGYLQFRF